MNAGPALGRQLNLLDTRFDWMPAGSELESTYGYVRSWLNVAKHAGISAASIRQSCQPGQVELCIGDDGGRGFVLAILVLSSLGLDIMRERAEAIGASLTIESRPGFGTQVEVLSRSSSQ